MADRRRRNRTQNRSTRSIASVIAIIAMMSIIVIASALLHTERIVPTSGIVGTADIRLYSDPALTVECRSITWGTLNPGQSVTYTIYVLNNGTVPLSLSMTTNNWVPLVAYGQIAFTWDRENVTLNSAEIVSAKLTLTVSPTIANVTDFHFNVVVGGTGG